MIGPVSVFAERRSGNAQLGVRSELPEEEFKVIWIERDVGVEITHHREVEVLHPREAGVEGMDLGGEVALTPRRPLNQLNPGTALEIWSDDRCRFVGGSIVDDYPLERTPRLLDHRLQRATDVGSFVVCGRDEHICQR